MTDYYLNFKACLANKIFFEEKCLPNKYKIFNEGHAYM